MIFQGLAGSAWQALEDPDLVPQISYSERATFYRIEASPRRHGELYKAFIGRRKPRSVLVTAAGWGDLVVQLQGVEPLVLFTDQSSSMVRSCQDIILQLGLQNKFRAERFDFMKHAEGLQKSLFDLVIVPAEAFQMFGQTVQKAIIGVLCERLSPGGDLLIDCVRLKTGLGAPDCCQYYDPALPDGVFVEDCNFTVKGERIFRARKQFHFADRVDFVFLYAIRQGTDTQYRRFCFSLFETDYGPDDLTGNGLSMNACYGSYDCGLVPGEGARRILSLVKEGTRDIPDC